MSFWNKLKKPIIALAPMADVTDAAFRRVIAKYSKPDGPAVMFTEFVSADGLVLAPAKGRKKLLKDLEFSESERPIEAQLFTGRPEIMRKAAGLITELGFDGLDINMGCPDRSIEKSGAGAALIKNPKLAREIIKAAHVGAPNLPISVKTRIGYNRNEISTWISELLKENLSALTVHLRTRKEMSAVPAHWDLMPEIVEMRDKISPQTFILGNGDVRNVSEAEEKVKLYGCDGVMLGRAVFGTPWLFSVAGSDLFVSRSDLGDSKRSDLESAKSQKLNILIEHTKLFEQLLGDVKNFSIMKKHFKAYVVGFDGAAELREKLMSAENSKGVENLIKQFVDTYP